jgi:MFS family permease
MRLLHWTSWPWHHCRWESWPWDSGRLPTPSADSLPLELAPAGLSGRYTAVHQLGWGVSAAIAPVLAGALLAAGRPTLWVVLCAASLALALAYVVARASLFDCLRMA